MPDIAPPASGTPPEAAKRARHGLPRLNPWSKARSGPHPAIGRSDRPVAAVVRGQAADYNEVGRTLPSLQAEIAEVERLLEGAGYQVVSLETGSFREFEQLRDEGLRERLVVFHYAGHATPSGLLLQSGNSSEYLVDPDQLADLLSPCDNLRVLFLNGCHAREQLRAFDNALLRIADRASAIDYAFIGAEGRIGDAVASAFATAVYAKLAAGSELGVAVRDATASARLAAENDGLDGNMAVAALRFQAHEQQKFHLADGTALIYDAVYDQARQICLKPFAVYLPIVAIVGVLSALLAYIWDPSPAFRTAFGLAPDTILKTFVKNWNDINVTAADRELMGYLPDSNIQHTTRTCADWSILVGSERHQIIESAYSGLKKNYGTIIDMTRTIVLSLALLFIVFKAWHMRFPRGVPMLSHARPGTLREELVPFSRSALGGAFIGIFLLGAILLLLYHVAWAPAKLANYWATEGGKAGSPWEGRWVLLHCLDEVWAKPGSAGDLVAAAGVSTGRAWSAFVDKVDPRDPVSAALYAALYQRPYVILSGNSTANFLFLMLPIAYVIAKSARFSWYWTDLGLRRVSILFRAPKVNEQRIETALIAVRDQARIATRTFSFVFFTMATVGVFEIAFGRVSLASMAQVMTIIAVVVFACGGLMILAVVFGIEGHRNELVRLLRLAKEKDPQVDVNGTTERQLKKVSVFRPLDWVMIAYGVIVIAVAIFELSGASNLMGLS